TLPPAAAFTVGAIPAGTWRRPPVADPTWQLAFRGLTWVKPLARRAAADGQRRSLDALVRQTSLFHRLNPDPGSSGYGWDEGTALRRLETENCLFALTRSVALIPGMVADVRVLAGKRYYGPPHRAVHNHGLMANLQLLRAGDLLRRPRWKRLAIGRIVAEAPQAFSRQGISLEQSSMYQRANAGLWRQAAVALSAFPEYAPAAAAIRADADNADRMFSLMTEPDGRITQIGDAEELAGRPRDFLGVQAVRDDESGWVIGRWPGRRATHYTVRYGPERRAHGHEDRAGGVTWSAMGVRVLVGPGRYSYDKADPYNRYQTRPDGQNVAVPAGGVVQGGTSVVTSTFGPARHSVEVRDTVYGPAHVRGVTVDPVTPRLVVSDSFEDTGSWRQHWHLDPRWVRVPGATLTFRHPAGRTLTITTTGRVARVVRGAAEGPYGWHFPRFQVREPSYQIMVDNDGHHCTTTFRLSITAPPRRPHDPSGRPSSLATALTSRR
ncbi:hypothetical protein AB0M20_40865, partial [Actinoplanes sp. NPDC051633]|uniref:hypothetical protein n=1 Tax=Actinoplanes sp. NPDC051633 TaxID=3155670 RepID=UPI003429F2C1